MTVDVKELYEEISKDEGKVLHAYLCSELHATVGIGHKILDTDPEKDLEIFGVNWEQVPDDQRISEHRCYVLFQEDVQIAISNCISLYDNWNELPQEAQHILVNMVFQLGKRGLSNFKNMNIAINAQDWGTMAEEMMDSRWAKQTPNRAERLQQRALSLVGV
jgi:lysozyme